jgi:uncharacterized FlaG/YvyC family protein
MITTLNNLDAMRLVSAHSRQASPATPVNPARQITASSTRDQAHAGNLHKANSPPLEQTKEDAEKSEEQKPVDLPKDQFRYRYDKRVEGLVVEVVDWKTSEVVRTIPPEEYIKLRAKIADLNNNTNRNIQNQQHTAN